jgi:histidinol-phosphate/aromatic aminotransferase/cobyric acid decarboxylase-like protein/N-acyl-L-homoserine lactone synthetase
MAKSIFKTANDQDRETIYHLRHEIYAEELNQYPSTKNYQLQDEIDKYNEFIIAENENEVVGFISITPPKSPKFSIDKYFNRSCIPYAFDEYLYEIRLLTVRKPNRNTSLALLLMYAAMRWVQSHGGKYIVAICRSDIFEMYKKAGLSSTSRSVMSGRVKYELATTTIETLNNIAKNSIFEKLKQSVDWKLPYTFEVPSVCYHGGEFFEAIGEDLQNLEVRNHIINADVLDAWFPPSPKVIDSFQNHLPWLLQTSPPTYCKGLIQTIAEVRGITPGNILPGAGSSDLIFRSFQHLLTSKSKVLILDPCYGEYIHVLENIIRCDVHRFKLKREEGFVVDINKLKEELQKAYDLVVIVNPNSPTGLHIPKVELQDILTEVPKSTIVWVDETYIEYAGSSESLEIFAAQKENIIICKSMSKVYALSGARVGYLVTSPHLIERLRIISPPWLINLSAQLAAITALKESNYYQQKYEQTHVLREKLKSSLEEINIKEIIPGIANFLMFYIPQKFGSVKEIIARCKKEKLFLRDVSNMGTELGEGAIRIAVKDELTNRKMVSILSNAMLFQE